MKKSEDYVVLKKKRGVYFHGFDWGKNGHPAKWGSRDGAVRLNRWQDFGSYAYYPETRDLEKVPAVARVGGGWK